MVLTFRNQCLAFKFVDEFVLYGKLNSREIVETVTLYEEFEQKNAESENDPARQIQSWGSMDEKNRQGAYGRDYFEDGRR